MSIARIDDLVKYHLKVEPIVYKYMSKDEQTGIESIIYMVKSIKRENQSYNVVCDNDIWICDCPSYKYKSGVDQQGHCKHIRFILFLIEENIEIAII